MAATHKQCPDCARQDIGPRPIDQFPIARRRPDGRGSYCFEHQRARTNASAERHRDSYEERRARGEIA